MGIGSRFARLAARNHIAAITRNARDYLLAVANRDSDQPNKNEIKAGKSYQKAIDALQDDFKKLNKESPDTKDQEMIATLQKTIIKHQTTLKNGHYNETLYKAAVLAEYQGLQKDNTLNNKSLLRNNLERELYGQTIHDRTQEVNQQREQVYKLHQQHASLPDNDPNKLRVKAELKQALTQYGESKAALFLDQLQLAGKDSNQRQEHIDKKIKSLHTNPGYQSQPVEKMLLAAECEHLPVINKKNFVDKVGELINYAEVSAKDADAHYSNREDLKAFLKQQLGPGYTVELIPSFNNVLFKISDGNNTVVAKLGIYANKLTQMNSDYPAALETMKDKSNFAEVYSTNAKKNGQDTLLFELGEYLPGENMGSYFKNQDTTTEYGRLQRQDSALTEMTNIIDMLEELAEQGIAYTDLKCGNFIRGDDGRFKIADMKSLLARGDHPDSAFSTSDIPVTFMTNDSVRETPDKKRYYDIDQVVKTALAAQMIEMLTLSQDAGTSPFVSFGEMKINWDQPILKGPLGEEFKSVYTKLTTDPNYSLNDAKQDVQALQFKIGVKMNEVVSQASNNLINHDEVKEIQRRTSELDIEVPGDDQKEVREISEKLDKVQVTPKTDSAFSRVLEELDDIIKSLEEAFKSFDKKITEQPKPTTEDRVHDKYEDVKHHHDQAPSLQESAQIVEERESPKGHN